MFKKLILVLAYASSFSFLMIQATLGLGAATEKSILQCSAGRKNPVFLCSLQPNNTESCPLNLQFDEDDVVVFSVIGPRSIHLSGFFAAADGDGLRDDYEQYPFCQSAIVFFFLILCICTHTHTHYQNFMNIIHDYIMYYYYYTLFMFSSDNVKVILLGRIIQRQRGHLNTTLKMNIWMASLMIVILTVIHLHLSQIAEVICLFCWTFFKPTKLI